MNANAFADGGDPRKVVLFSGHMIDAPDRPLARFPATREPLAARAIEAALASLDAGAGDLALSGGACGGDLLFAEAALRRGLRLALYLPFEEDAYLPGSVDFAGAAWRDRYDAVRSQATLHLMPRERPALPEAANPYEAANAWMLEQALRFGAGRVDFICLWNGQDPDGPGGTGHLLRQVRQAGGRVQWIDTTVLWT